VTGLATGMGCLVGLGSGFLLLRAVSQDHEAFSVSWSKAFRATSTSGPVFAAFFCVAAAAFVGHRAGIEAIALLSLSELCFYPYVQLASWAFQAHERLGWANALPTAAAASRLLAALLFVALTPGHDLIHYLWMNLAAMCLVALASVLLVRGLLKPRATRSRIFFADVKEGLGFSAQWFTSSAMAEFDKTLVLRLAGSEITGLYAVAYRVASALSLPIGALAQAAMPRLFRAHQEGADSGRDLTRRLLMSTLAYSVAGTVLLQGMAVVLPLILGPKFAPAMNATRWLALWLPFYGLRAIGSSVLMTSGRQLLRAGTEIVALLMMLGIAILLIPKFGLSGAVATAILTEALLAIFTWGLIWRAQAANWKGI
jgi:O-antigen/teichoic acid export membrane protein